MQICFDYQIFSLQNVGGISRYFIELAQRLPLYDNSFDTTVMAPVHINSYLADSKIRVKGKKINAFPGKHRVLPAINKLASDVLLTFQKPDIIHETYYLPQRLSLEVPRVVTVYDMIHERFPDQFTGPDLLVPEQKASAVSRADHVIAISHNTCNDLIQYLGVAAEKISVIPLAASLGRNHIKRGRKKTGRPYLLYVGLRSGVKNFKRLLNAYCHSKILKKEYDLYCVGGGEFSSEELQNIHAAKAEKNVIHLQADDRMLEELYMKAALFIYPSLYEGFGLPLLDAMRCGCPVVCSKTSSMPEIAGGAALYFNPENEEEIQAVLEDALLSEEKRIFLRNQGYKREKLYTWENCMKQTAEVYRSLVK